MTEAEIVRLAASGETDTAEFKKTTGEKDAGLRTLCGMLNGSGGRVLFGVTPTGKVLGQDVSDSTQIELAQAYAHFEPPAPIQQEGVTLSNGRVVLVVSVVAGGQSPYTFQGRPYQRVNTTTSTLPQVEYQQRLLERNHATRRWENLPASQPLALDQVEIGRTLTDAVAAGRLESAITDPVRALEKLG